LNKQLNVVQTIHYQQLDHILSFKRAAPHTQHVGVTRKSDAECENLYIALKVSYKNKNCTEKLEVPFKKFKVTLP